MGLTGKLTMSLDINSSGYMIYDTFRYRPNDLTSISRNNVRGCEVDGQQGAVGTFRYLKYVDGGKNKGIKEKIEEVDETNYKIVLKVIEGDLLGDLYKSFKIMFHVEPKGDGHLAIWSLEFEKLNRSVPYPTTFMECLLDVTKDLDVHKTSH